MSEAGQEGRGGADHGRANLGQLGFRRVDVLHRLDLLDLRHLLHVLDLVQLLVLRLAGVDGRRQRGRHELVHLVRLLVGAHRRLEVLLLELELLRLLHVLLLHLLRRVGRRRLHRHARRGRGQGRRRRRRRARRRKPVDSGHADRRGRRDSVDRRDTLSASPSVSEAVPRAKKSRDGV